MTACKPGDLLVFGEAMNEINLRISLFDNKRSTRPQVKTLTWQSFFKVVASPVVRMEKDGELFSPVVFTPPYRKKENVRSVALLVLDYDHLADVEGDFNVWCDLGVACLLYTSHSHLRKTECNPNAEPRFRVVVLLFEPIPAKYFASLWAWAAAQSGGKIDGAAKDSSRMYYLPAIYSADSPFEFRVSDGEPLDWRRLNLTAEPEKPAAKEKKPRSMGSGIARPAATLTAEDEALVEMARQRFGAKFDRLYSGSAVDYPDPKSGLPDDSRADIAFAVMLLLVGAIDAQVERIWRGCGRNREKLNRHKSYIPMTIDSAREWIESHQDVVDISDLEEIDPGDPPVSDNPVREKYLRQVARNTAKVMETYTILLRLLNFKKNHLRLLCALTAIGRDRLGTFVAAQEWIREKYQEGGENSSEDTVRRDIKRLRAEQEELGIALISYTAGSMNAQGEKFASQFKNHLLRYALEAISLALDIRNQFKHSSAALEAACKVVVERIPRVEPKTTDLGVKQKKMKTISDLESRRYHYENAMIEQMIAEGWSQSEIEAQFETLEHDRQRRVNESFRIRVRPISKSVVREGNQNHWGSSLPPQ